jgi:glycerol uptake facilitator protein
MPPYLAEFLGTAILIFFGDGVVANVLLNKSKAQNSGWIVITAGWGFAVAIAVYAVGSISGAHINPAVTIALASIGKFAWASVPAYIVAQLAGAFVGAVLVWLLFLPHWRETESEALKLAVFSTGPAIRNYPLNVLTEALATVGLVYGVLAIAAQTAPGTSGLTPLLIGILVWAIGISHGGPTGYAINPARDLGPRIAHFVLPIPGKGNSDWAYSWVPVVGPIIGGVVGALLFQVTLGVK